MPYIGLLEIQPKKRLYWVHFFYLQSHVNDCIKWKDTHRVKENGLKDQLQKEQQKTNNLERRLAAVNTAMNSASTTLLSTGTIETLLSEIENQSQKLKEIMGSSKEVCFMNFLQIFDLLFNWLKEAK